MKGFIVTRLVLKWQTRNCAAPEGDDRVRVVDGVVDDLVVAHPDLAVGDGERHGAVEEGLGLGVAPGRAEGHGEEVPDRGPVRLRVEGAVEAEQRARAQAAVAREAQLVHGVHVLHEELGARALGRARHPHVEVGPLPRLEVDAAVAALELADLVELPRVVLRVELRVALVVGQQLLEVLEQVAVPRGRAPAADDEHALLVDVAHARRRRRRGLRGLGGGRGLGGRRRRLLGPLPLLLLHGDGLGLGLGLGLGAEARLLQRVGLEAVRRGLALLRRRAHCCAELYRLQPCGWRTSFALRRQSVWSRVQGNVVLLTQPRVTRWASSPRPSATACTRSTRQK